MYHAGFEDTLLYNVQSSENTLPYNAPDSENTL